MGYTKWTPRTTLKLIPHSLRTSCILILIRNYRHINFTILPEELSTEIMLAIREPEYEKHIVTVCGVGTDIHTAIVEYCSHYDTSNKILRYYDRGTPQYDAFYRNLGTTPAGVIYDASRDVFIATDYTHLVNRVSLCYIAEDLRQGLLYELETKYKIELISAPLSAIIPAPDHLSK